MFNVTVTKCTCQSFGGGLLSLSNSTLNATNCLFSRNEAPTSGGSVAVSTGSVILVNSTLESSTAGSAGGGAYISGARVSLASVTVQDNFAEEQGGGIHTRNSILVATDTTLDRNVANNDGGGMNIVSSPMVDLSNCRMTSNRADYGGAVYVSSGSVVTISDCSGFKNSALTSGGLAFVLASNVALFSGLFAENSGSYGGGILIQNGRLNVTGCEFLNGSATSSGAGLDAIEGSFIHVHDTLFASNTAEFGGAVYLMESYFWGSHVRVSNCKADTDGGAIVANQTSSLLCSGCIFERNSASGKGGGVYLESDRTQLLAFQFDNCTFERNSAALGGNSPLVNDAFGRVERLRGIAFCE